MCLAHRLLYLVWVGINDNVCSDREAEVCEATLEDVRDWQKLHCAVFIADVYHSGISCECCIVLTVCEHNTL